jgi:lysyl-tRNA synthetase class 2
MAEDDLLQFRRDKLAALEEAGTNPYPARCTVESTVQAARAPFEDTTAEDLDEQQPVVRLAGRVTALREHGRSAFSDLDDGTARLQCHVRQKQLGEDSFAAWLQLDLGDFVALEGPLFRTRTGELTVRVDRWELVSKSLRPMPEKWHGLKDTEVRYRQRYLDLLANPEVREIFRQRAAIVRSLRAHLDANDFLEVETPTLQPLYGGAAARPFRTHHNTLDLDLYLRIAPELYLKRLLVGGLQRVYDLNRNFRNEGISRQHNPEFTMLEFYAAYWDYERMMDFAEELLCVAFGDPEGTGTLKYQEGEIPLRRPWDRVTLRDALIERGDMPADVVDDEEALRAWLQERDVQVDGLGPGGLREAAFDKTVKPHQTAPLFVIDYPLEISPLSKIKPGTEDVVERFELFMGGMEIANGYSELNDPREQGRRMRQQVEGRGDDDEVPPAVDEDYITALEHGMPPAAGIGIGVDRLAMLATDSPTIRDVILFPLLRPRD